MQNTTPRQKMNMKSGETFCLDINSDKMMDETRRSYRPIRRPKNPAYQPVHIAGDGASVNFNVRNDDDMSTGYESENMKVK